MNTTLRLDKVQIAASLAKVSLSASKLLLVAIALTVLLSTILLIDGAKALHRLMNDYVNRSMIVQPVATLPVVLESKAIAPSAPLVTPPPKVKDVVAVGGVGGAIVPRAKAGKGKKKKNSIRDLVRTEVLSDRALVQ
jgi:hypothetical protein